MVSGLLTKSSLHSRGKVTTYKMLDFKWALWGRVMHGSLLLQLLILLVVANATAVAAKKLLGVVFARPLGAFLLRP